MFYVSIFTRIFPKDTFHFFKKIYNFFWKNYGTINTRNSSIFCHFSSQRNHISIIEVRQGVRQHGNTSDANHITHTINSQSYVWLDYKAWVCITQISGAGKMLYWCKNSEKKTLQYTNGWHARYIVHLIKDIYTHKPWDYWKIAYGPLVPPRMFICWYMLCLYIFEYILFCPYHKYNLMWK